MSAKQIMSHHFGFGNIHVEKVAGPYINNKATKIEASGKFKEKLMLKQRQLEVSIGTVSFLTVNYS